MEPKGGKPSDGSQTAASSARVWPALEQRARVRDEQLPRGSSCVPGFGGRLGTAAKTPRLPGLFIPSSPEIPTLPSLRILSWWPGCSRAPRSSVPTSHLEPPGVPEAPLLPPPAPSQHLSASLVGLPEWRLRSETLRSTRGLSPRTPASQDRGLFFGQTSGMHPLRVLASGQSSPGRPCHHTPESRISAGLPCPFPQLRVSLWISGHPMADL